MSEDESSHEEPSSKRPRVMHRSGGFGAVPDDTAEAQLEAMLSGPRGPSQAGAPPGGAGSFSGVVRPGESPQMSQGMGAGMGGGMGMPGGMPSKGGGKGQMGIMAAMGPMGAMNAMVGVGGDMGGMAGLLPDANKVETTQMDFSKLNTPNAPTSTVEVQRQLVETLMTSDHRRILTEESGANVEWVPEEHKVELSGSAEQVKRAQRLLARVMMHSRWGYSETKVRRLLKPWMAESVLVRLSPMNTLKPCHKTLTYGHPELSIGKDKDSDAVIRDNLISRLHCLIEIDEERGAVYAIDYSTNGTFLNGVRLPKKEIGKVLLSHGDELLLKDPQSGEQEFGYIVNLTELAVKQEVKLEAPRRILTAEESSSVRKDAH